MMTHLRLLIICLGVATIFSSFSGCSNNEAQVDLTGYWTGRTENFGTNKSWDIRMYFYQNENQLSGVFSDYRGSISIYDSSYVGSDIEFSIQLETGYVRFSGERNSENRLDGNWVYSESGNEGVFLLIREDDDFSEGEADIPADEASDSTGMGNPFA